MLHRIAAVLLAIVLSGCASFVALTDSEASEQNIGVDRHSSYPAMRRVYFEQVNLIELIDPKGEAEREYVAAWTAADGAGDSRKQWGRKYDLVFAWFRDNPGPSAEQRRIHRNSIQERVLSVSVSRCNVFKTFLRRDQSDKNFALGAATTIAGALGAILQGATASRNLAGTAGILSGIQGEYNQAYFSNLTAAVIIKGIESRQTALYDRLRRVGQPMSVADYPLEAAVKDAVYFDGMCSTVIGLEEASESITLANNPGLEAASRTVLRSRILQRIANDDLGELSKSDLLPRLGISLEDVYRAPVAIPAGSTVATMAGDELFRAVDRVALTLHGRVQELAKKYGTAYGQREKAQAGTAFDAEAIAKKVTAVSDKYVADATAALVDRLKLADCTQLASKAATEIAAAENQLRAATTESQKIAANEQLSSRQLKGAVLLKRVSTMTQLAEVDLRTHSAAHIDALAKADTSDKLKALAAPTFAAKESAAWTCGTLESKG